MGNTLIQNIFQTHSKEKTEVDDIIDVGIDIRVARDFGGANVVKNIRENNLSIDDPAKTFFTFDCNPGGCDQKYAANQHICRLFAREQHIHVYDINRGIGTHVAFEDGLVQPGGTFVSTDSHANILGAIGAFGQGMGDVDIAHAFAHGKTWFKVPPTKKIILKGTPSPLATPKDVVLKMAGELGANGLLGCAAELYGHYVDCLALDGRVTIASMATEMGAITLLFPPNEHIETFYQNQINVKIHPLYADSDASYEDTIEIDIEGLTPQIAQPGHPDDVVPVSDLQGTPLDSGFIGSCTNGRVEDFSLAASILRNATVATGRILKLVPATDIVWKQLLNNGSIADFKKAGALIGSAGCAGCAAGQIGQTGKDENAISTGNRNFPGKQGKGNIYLASPATVAASLISGHITSSDHIASTPAQPAMHRSPKQQIIAKKSPKTQPAAAVSGRAWVIQKDNIDTDMIYHNRYLFITDIKDMGQYTFDNLTGYEHFANQARSGDIIVTGKNFGCGSSRQQAVDCFKSLGIHAIIAESFGAIYERNAINNAFPILTAEDITKKIEDKDTIHVDFLSGKITDTTQQKTYQAKPFSTVKKDIYLRGGLLKR